MSKLKLNITMSIDGFVAGPDCRTGSRRRPPGCPRLGVALRGGGGPHSRSRDPAVGGEVIPGRVARGNITL